MKKKFNLHFLNCVSIVAAGLLVTGSISANAQCTATNALTMPAQFLGSGFTGSGNFNAIVFGDYNTGDGGTDGRLAVGGNFTLNSSLVGYQVGVTGLSPVGEDNFIVNGQLTNTTGKSINVRGNFYYGSLLGGSPLPVHEPGQGTNNNQSGRINFTDLKQHYVSMSNDYENLAASDSPDPIVSDGNIVLTGDNTVKNYVFNVSVSTNVISGVSFVNIPAGSGILINILNTNISIASTATSFPMVDTHRPRTLFNFPNAVSILLNSFEIEGGILAPQANLFVLQTGGINGPAVIGGNISQATGFSFNSACLSYPLPVKLVSFAAKKEGNLANLKWETSSEINAENFIIQRKNGNKWQVIGEVEPKGQSNVSAVYDFSDRDPLNGENLYQLKMTDRDGTFAYSKMVSLNFKVSSGITAFPNPVVEQLSFSNVNWEDVSNIQISNQVGKNVPFQLSKEKNVNVQSWTSGLYIIHITSKNGNTSTQKVLKY